MQTGFPKFGRGLTAVLQLLHSETTRSSVFFLKKRPPCTPLDSARVLENRSNPPSPASVGGWLGDVPLFHAAWLFAVGLALTESLQFRSSFLLISLMLAVPLCAVAAFRAQRIVWLPLTLLWCLLGAWCAQMEPLPIADPTLESLSDGLLRTVEGTVVEAGSIQSEQNLEESADEELPSQRVDIHLSSIELVTDNTDVQIPSSGNVRLTVRWPLQDRSKSPADSAFHCGDQLRAVARLLQPETYHDPGAWSREQYLVEQGVTATATVSFERIERLSPSQASPFACRIGAWQRASTQRLLALPQTMRHLPELLRVSPQDAAMLAAMVAGDRAYLTHSLRAGFERTGSFHMLVVSGFHLAIVAACLFWITRLLRIPRVPATLLTIVEIGRAHV